MSKAWGAIGDWAADVEREEREAAAEAAAAAASGVSAESQNFPSLREAATKQKKKKMTLNEFHTSSGGLGTGRALESKGLTPDEMLRLPTGPKERSAEEMQYGRLGGGFSNYGRSGPPPGRMRDRDETDGGSWGGGRRQYGGFDEERRGPPSRVSDYDQPSRADEVDNWAMTKKPLSSFDSGRQNRYGSLGSGGGMGGGSRADEVDNWGTAKKPLPTRSSTFGSGFRDSGPEPDRWTRGGNREPERERPRLVLDPPKGDVAANESVRTNRPNPFGAARPREQVLAEKGLDWKKLELEIEAKRTSAHSSRPTSAHSSRPSSAQSSRSEGPGLQQGLENLLSKPRPKVNPFGDAKPREVLLEERGQDWRKIDLQLEHRSVDRSETEEEKLLKEEIEHLKERQKELLTKGNRETLQGSDGDQSNLQDIISLKEKELEQLIRDLDDKIRFGQKAVDRPGSGSGRGSFSERPSSQSGSFDESRSVEYIDRPQSRGAQDAWTRPIEDRRPFQSGKERGFLGSRDFDRSRSRERW
ncbi:eukaryotic translation initiation factor 4B2 [Jatropha curcas]|uniref:eukaryotic translation initiation factor 4B2 n=1 Tax=Jatropha curcas TaxID=180498 RepID=UPI0009D687F7|nr:eukaryotic translation initiation factor 4B2 [Jatropha curcas]XP_020539119.2 eukaryotic translation initiation factor 4B2 [Jatropha curcas]